MTASRTSYADYTVPLKAGQTQVLQVQGDYVQVMSAAFPITFKSDKNATITRQQGQGCPFDYTRVELVSASDQNVVVSLGFAGDHAPYDVRGGFSGATITSTTKPPNTVKDLPDTTVAAGALTQIASSNISRNTLVISLPTTAPNGVRVGSASVSAAQGALMEPGDRLVLDGNYSVFVFNPGANPVTVTVTELASN